MLSYDENVASFDLCILRNLDIWLSVADNSFIIFCALVFCIFSKLIKSSCRNLRFSKGSNSDVLGINFITVPKRLCSKPDCGGSEVRLEVFLCAHHRTRGGAL